MRLEVQDLEKARTIPGTNLRVTFEGLAWLHLNENQLWKVRFPTAPDHTLRMAIRKEAPQNEEKGEFIIPVGSNIAFTHNGAASPGAADRTFNDNALNISDLHPDVKFIQPLADLDRVSSSLQLPNATMLPLGNPFNAEVLKKDTRTNIKSFKASKEGLVPMAEADVIVGAAGNTQIAVSGKLSFAFTLSYSGGERYHIRISNHCEKPECASDSDFRFYYQLIEKRGLRNLRHALLANVKFDDLDPDPGRNARAPCNIIYSANDPE